MSNKTMTIAPATLKKRKTVNEQPTFRKCNM